MGRVREGTYKKHEPRTTVAQTAEEQCKKELMSTRPSAVRDVMSGLPLKE